MARKRTQAYMEVTEGGSHALLFPSHGLRNTRDLHTVLVQAAYELQRRPDLSRAQITLQECTLSKGAVQREVDQFLSICRPSVAKRLQVLDSRLGTNDARLSQIMDGIGPSSAYRPTQASQEAVIAALLQRYILGQPGLTVAELVVATGASLPTVYQAIQRYGASLARRDREDKALRIEAFSHSAWKEWMDRSNRLSIVSFVDHSGAPRSSTRLAKALARLQRDDLAIGGLMGAMHHLPAIDATAAPHLDVLVHGTARSDLSFVEQLDPGLQRSRDPQAPAHVVVHFVDRPQSLFVREDGHNWGSLPDCIANMYRAHQTHQVSDAIRLTVRRQ